MTGAPLPEGADCVLMQELTDSGEETVQLYAAVKPLQNVVFRGEDVAAGAVIAPAGTVLTPAHLGVLAGQGYTEVSVYRPLTVGVLATGSELLEPGAPWAPGKIYDANGIQNAARLRQLGFSVERQQCSDDPEVITGKMQELLTRCDAVITSGGVSVGQKDYLPRVLEQLGAQLLVEGVAQKPGSPMLAATLGGKLVFCLSGNPFAAAATLEQYAIPALLPRTVRENANTLSSVQIAEILPHRYPFALVDRVLDYEPGQWAIGRKCVTRNEEFFNGHFPAQPVMPGVLLLEALAQTGAVAALSLPENKGKLALFGGIKSARFRKQVTPGDVLTLHCELVQQHGAVGVARVLRS